MQFIVHISIYLSLATQIKAVKGTDRPLCYRNYDLFNIGYLPIRLGYLPSIQCYCIFTHNAPVTTGEWKSTGESNIDISIKIKTCQYCEVELNIYKSEIIVIHALMFIRV